MKIKNHKLKLLAFCLLLTIWGCKTMAMFDQYAYTQTTSLKVDVLNLIDKSNEPYSSHVKECEIVISDLMKMREYEKHRPN